MPEGRTKPSLALGQVRASWGGHGVVRLDSGQQIDCKYRRRVGRPVCGDRVGVNLLQDGTGCVEVIEDRTSHFARADDKNRQVTVAANLDLVLVVIAPHPAPSRDLLNRYLVAIHSLDLRPLVVINKVELLDDAETREGFTPINDLPILESLGYPVLNTSCKGPPGIAALAGHLDGMTSILVGQSGVGKSSLVQALLPNLEVQVGELSRATGKGTHTTTTTTLYDLPAGGRLIDSPGVWEFGIWKLDDAELAAGFVEFRPFLGDCRFNDCRHSSEPDCAIKAAVNDGEIHRQRYEGYLRLLEQNAES